MRLTLLAQTLSGPTTKHLFLFRVTVRVKMDFRCNSTTFYSIGVILMKNFLYYEKEWFFLEIHRTWFKEILLHLFETFLSNYICIGPAVAENIQNKHFLCIVILKLCIIQVNPAWYIYRKEIDRGRISVIYPRFSPCAEPVFGLVGLNLLLMALRPAPGTRLRFTLRIPVNIREKGGRREGGGGLLEARLWAEHAFATFRGFQTITQNFTRQVFLFCLLWNIIDQIGYSNFIYNLWLYG